jgi:hypothetical protein
MSPQEIASWIFGSILLVFVLTIFVLERYVLNRGPIEAHQQNLLGFICSILAGLFAFFFTGTFGVSFSGHSTLGKLAAQATGGAGAFVIVLWWWRSSLAPIQSKKKPIKISDHSVPMKNTPRGGGSSSSGGTP